MAAAYLLSRRHEVHLFEKDHRIGGHTQTHSIEQTDAPGAPPLQIDSGFIVHNEKTYPNLIRLFHELGVERQKSDMSFAVTDRQTGFEYSSHGLRGFFATKRNLLRPGHYRFMADMFRFYREAAELLLNPANLNLTLGDYLRSAKFGHDFARYYLYPMTASVWSTSLEEVEQFPAFTLIRFFENHGWLGRNTNPQWYVLKGGSSSYIPALTAPYRERIHLGAGIKAVRRTITADPQSKNGVELVFENRYGDKERKPEWFDEVVLACHAPQAIAVLADATPCERTILGSFRTSRNEAVLHTDEKILPRRQVARAAWNYSLGTTTKAVTLTYSMNRLQNLEVLQGTQHKEYCVTLNETGLIDPKKVLRTMEYSHPLYTLDAVRAQSRWAEISGHHHTHFAGAYWFYGFHEDGLNSALRVAKALGVDW